MTAREDFDRQLDAFLQDGPTELPERSFYAVRDHIQSTGQRVVIGPWRLPTMNKFVPTAIVAATLVVAVAVGPRLLGLSGSTGPGGMPSSPSPSPTPTVAPTPDPTPTPWTGIPAGPFLISDGEVRITVDVAAPGWVPFPDFEGTFKNDDGLDSPQSTGALLLAWAWPRGTGISVYGDPCQWMSTIPEAPATTADEIAAAFAAQAETSATAPVPVTVGGYAGVSLIVQVPMSYEVPGATREEKFGDCDADTYAYYGIGAKGSDGIERNAQGAGQIDELWILDVDGAIVILDAAYGPAVPAELIDEMRSIAESATFEVP